MSPAAPARRSDAAVLGTLYARNKALALSVGASLTLGRRPAETPTELRRHLAECERAARAGADGELSVHLAACRDAAADLVALIPAAGPDAAEPSRERIAAARASHRRLRRLVWDVFDCEYTPCGHERSN